MIHGPVVTRRLLLTGALSTAALAACRGGGGGDPEPSGQSSTPPARPSDDVAAEALEAAGLTQAEVELSPQMTWPELIIGAPHPLQLVVSTDDGALVTDPVDLWLVGDDGQVKFGPATTTWYPDDRIPSGGLHSVVVEVDSAGILDVVIATGDHAQAGTGAVQAMAAADSVAPAPGEVVPALATPTVADPKDLNELCTREPDCNLHDVTLEQALGTGNPVVLCIATPKFCSTAMCGPVLEDVISVADGGGFPDTTFVHVEPFSDAGETTTSVVDELALPTEPWTFVLQSDGTIAERFPGPVVPQVLSDILANLST